MILKLKNPLLLTLSVDTLVVNPNAIFIDENGVPQQMVNINIKAAHRLGNVVIPESVDEEGNITPERTEEQLIEMTSPYNLENPSNFTHVPFELVAGLIQAHKQPEILPFINQKIKEAGFESKFKNSLEGLDLEIAEVII